MALLVAGPATIALAPADVALADPQSDLEAAAAELDALGAELSDYQDQLASATTSLEDTDVEIAEKQTQIEQTSQELEQKRAELGASMSSSYKSGSGGLLEFILGSTSAEELVSRIYYLDKVSEQQAANIQEVRSLADQLDREMSELEERQSSQQQQVSDLQAQVDAYQARVADATSYYDSLDEQVRAQLVAEQESNANISTVVNAVETSQEQQAAQGQQGGNGGGGSAPEQQEPPAADQPTGGNGGGQAEQPPSDGGNGGGGSTGGSSVPAGQGVATAYAQIGKPYVYGATGPDAFDCSGLVCYCFGYARGRTTTAMISSLQASGDWKTDMSQLAVGDLVFPTTGHVGIYVGNGMMIHAANPATGVVLASVYSFIGGGSYY
ncbi:C40 family peptidase [Olsenella profusa]|uniref:C40 family peptidase n=2 Tax=Olsenella profusa TaxID=138595 RepID=A0ABS2F2S3_9ACTN|nr:C40 family peptidase [Olsenella profusa]